MQSLNQPYSLAATNIAAEGLSVECSQCFQRLSLEIGQPVLAWKGSEILPSGEWVVAVHQSTYFVQFAVAGVEQAESAGFQRPNHRWLMCVFDDIAS